MADRSLPGDRIRGGARGTAEPGAGAEATAPPPGTTELGVDIIRVDRVAAALNRFGERFAARILTPAEVAYVHSRPSRRRPDTLAGRWAAKEAVSKVLGLGVRGVGWREIEIERLPTGQPAVKLHGRASRRADQLGMDRIALSISHEAEYAVAIAYGVRRAGGRFLLPLDLDERLDEREQALLRRMARLRGMAAEAASMQAKLNGPGEVVEDRVVAAADRDDGDPAGSSPGASALSGAPVEHGGGGKHDDGRP